MLFGSKAGVGTVASSRRDFLKTITTAAILAEELRAEQLDFLRSPYVHNIANSEASVRWTLRTKVDCELVAGDQVVPATVREFPASQTGLAQTYFQYEARLDSLSSNSVHAYLVRSAGRVIPPRCRKPAQFRTSGTGDLSFLHFADSGSGDDDQLQLARQMAEENVSLVLANGDLAYPEGSYEALESRYFGVYHDMMVQVPFYTAAGNHEYEVEKAAPYLTMYSFPAAGVPARDHGRYYSFDWSNVHFVALDSNQPLTDAASGSGTMLQWLEADLRKTQKFWKVVFFHHAPYANGVHENDPEPARAREYIAPILERYGVQLVLNGHEHSYQRTVPIRGGKPDENGIVYVTSGGGGGALYDSPSGPMQAVHATVKHYVRVDVSGGTLQLVARRIGDGAIIDQVRIAPAPRILAAPLNSASYTADLASGGLMTIFGQNLAFSEDQRATSVTLDATPLKVLYAGAQQINAQLPADFQSSGQLSIATPNGAAEVGIAVKAIAPAIFTDANGTAIAVHSDGTRVSPGSPARPSETILLWTTGLGPTASGSRVVADIRVWFEGTPRMPVSCLGSGAAGYYRVTVQMPETVSGELTALRVQADGVMSPAAALPSLS